MGEESSIFVHKQSSTIVLAPVEYIREHKTLNSGECSSFIHQSNESVLSFLYFQYGEIEGSNERLFQPFFQRLLIAVLQALMSMLV